MDASAIIAAAETTDTHLPEGWTGLLETFAEIDIAETTALLNVAAAFLEDDLQRRRVHRVLAGRRQPMSGFVTGPSAAKVTTACFMGDDLGDGGDILLGVDFPDGTAMTASLHRPQHGHHRQGRLLHRRAGGGWSGTAISGSSASGAT